MRPIRIFPEYALILTYDIRPGTQERYFRYVTGEFLPAMERRELYMQNAWHIVYGSGPTRQVEFITEELDTIRDLFDDPEWDTMEDRLKDYTENYARHVVRYRGHFKVIVNSNS